MKSEASKPEVVVVCGPTCVGKTAVAIDLAAGLGGEIVGADSMQVYRHMDIGTAKPSPAEQAAVAHHMIDVVDPDQPFDAARYAAMARTAVTAIHRRGRLPIVAGGTGLYIRALLGGLFESGAEDAEARRRLRQTAEAEGVHVLHRRLQACDPAAARRLHPNDTLRIIRALEVHEVTGRPLSEYQAGHRFGDRPYRVLGIGLDMARRELFDRIDRRVEAMLAGGFQEEVEGLLEKGYNENLKPMQAIGYRHMIDFILGRVDRHTLEDTMKRDTRRYAKRQMTWFRADPQILWHPAGDRDDIRRRVEAFLGRS